MSRPVIKPNLVYQPLVKNGFPDVDHDSHSWKDFLEEEWDRCINGWQPRNHSWIPGKYYFHTNWWKISRLAFSFDEGHKVDEKITSYPIYRKFDHEFANHLHECQNGDKKKNCLIGKFRRAGVTDMCMSYVAHDLLFFPQNQCGIGVPYERNFPLILPKLYTGLASLPPDFYQGFIYDNETELQIGFQYKDKMGNLISGGSQSLLFKKIMNKAGAFKGSWVKTLLLEEVGEYDKEKPTLRQVYAESRDCVEEGGNQFGIIILAGTSDKINNKNGDYELMYYQPEAFNLSVFFLPDTKWHYIIEKKKYAFDFKTGESKEAEANKDIDKHIELLNELPDRSELYKYMQNHPRIGADMFIVTGGGSLDIAKVNERIQKIMSDPLAMNRVQVGNLVEDSADIYKVTGGLRFQSDPKGRFRITEHPVNHIYKLADIASCDDYMKNKADSSPSKGAIVVYRRFISADVPCKIPVAVYWHRPPTLREFYGDCLKMAKYYQCEMAFEMNTTQPDLSPIYEYFKQKNALRYLKQYALILGKGVRKAEAFGYQVRQNEIDITDLKLNDFIASPELNNVFDLLFLNQLAMTGRINTDIISAFRVCLLYNDDIRLQPARKILSADEQMQAEEVEKNNPRPRNNSFAFSMGDDGKPAPTFKVGNSALDFDWQSDLRRFYGQD